MCALSPCVQYQDGQKRRKPNYSSVDLSEVEWEDKDDVVSVKPLKLDVQNVRTNHKTQQQITKSQVTYLLVGLVFFFFFLIYCCVLLFAFLFLDVSL